MDSPEEFRLFVALMIPAAVKSAIQKVQEDLRRLIPHKAARWSRSEQFHLTLRFLGNVPGARVQELVESLRRACAPFSPLNLKAGGIGFFPNARFPRVVWVGIKDAQNQFAALWASVQSATQPFTEEAAESEFIGHVTLARLNRMRREEVEELAGSAAKLNEKVLGEWTAGELGLMRSQLLPEGARHELLASVALGTKEPAVGTTSTSPIAVGTTSTSSPLKPYRPPLKS